MIKKIICGLSLMGSVCVYAQTVSGFENVITKVDSSYNGNMLDQGAVSGAGHFWNSYNKAWGSWSGFAFSSKTDTVTGSWTNQYSCISGNGANNSMSYSVAYSYAEITFTESAMGDSIYGFSLNNSTYAYRKIQNGDNFTKKFGGVSGNDTDFFKVVIRGYLNGKKTGEIDFYLADYRFSDNSKDYILKNWTWVDLKTLGRVDDITLDFKSTDVGQFGINTPTYVCLDSMVFLNSTNKFRPVAKDDQFLSAFDATNNAYPVLQNDKDPDGLLVGSNVKILARFNQGTTNINTDGTIELVQNTNAYGWDTCWYSVTDADLLADSAKFVLLINKVPFAHNDTYRIVKNVTDTFNVLLNDKDEAMDSLNLVLRKLPTKGSVVVTSNKLVYTPNDTLGMDTIRYQIMDEYGLIDSAEVYITLDIKNGLRQIEQNLPVSVFPNPAHDQVKVELDTKGENYFTLTDISGRIVVSEILSNSGEIQVSEFKRGIYILTISNGNKLSKQKIILD